MKTDEFSEKLSRILTEQFGEGRIEAAEAAIYDLCMDYTDHECDAIRVEGYDEGYDEGHREGFVEGREEGYEDGYDERDLEERI